MTSSSKKQILVVGGAHGIGRMSVDRLIALGHHLLVVDRDQQELAKCRAEWGAGVETRGMDLTDREAVRGALHWVKERAGVVDAAVMTAAVHNTHPVEYLPDDLIDQVLEVNLVAQIKFLRDVIPLVRAGGRIIVVSSVSAGVGIPMESLYSASKAGLELFCECMSLELSYKDIRCVIIQPGNVNTGFNETGNSYRPVGNPFIDGLYRKILERTHSRYGIPPERVARAIVDSITRRNPKLCVLVGGNAIKAHWAKRLLGRDIALMIVKKMMCR